MLRKIAVALALVFVAVACGKGEPETSGENVDEAKAVLASLLEASLKDDFAAARGHLDMGQYLQAMDSPLAFKKDMTEEEIEAETRSCFNQLLVVGRESKLKTRADIDGALRGANVEFLPQTRSAKIKFQAPDATRNGVIKFASRLTQTPGGTWKMITFEIEF